MKNEYARWAKAIADTLSNDDLNELTELLDEDVNHEFFHQLNMLNAKRNPEVYSFDDLFGTKK